MPTPAVRIPPLPPEEWDDTSRQIFSIIEGEEARRNGSRYNTILTIANHPELALAYLPFSHKLLRESTLPGRLREILILRTAFHYNCAYIIYQHRKIGQEEGLSTEEIDAIVSASPDTMTWTPLESAVIRSVDEMKSSGMVSDANWAVLSDHFDKKQLIEFIFTTGNYALYSMYLNNCGVQIES